MSDLNVNLKLSQNVDTELRKVSAAARSTANILRGIGDAADSAASSIGSEFGNVGDDISELGESISEVFNLDFTDFDMSECFDGVSDDISEIEDSLDDVLRTADRTLDSTDRLGEGLDNLGDSDMGDISNDIDDLGESMDEATDKTGMLGNALKALAAIVSVAAITSAISNFTQDVIEVGQSFSSQMSEVQAISGATGAELASMEQLARQYGATTVFSASEAAEALKYMSLAGWDANQSSAALEGVLNLAASSGMELGQASDMVTDYLSAFGMQASEATYMADMLAYAQSHSNTTAEQLGEAYKNSAANMNAAGQDIETTTSFLEAMANQGLKGSEAGTALAATMRDITQKMDDGAIKIGDTSIAVQDAQGNFRDLTDILTDVETATQGMGDAEKAAALGATFTADSIKGLNMILNEGMDNVAGYEEALRHTTGTAEDMASTMNDNLAGDIANMNSAFQEMQLQVFDAIEGPLRDGAQYITNTVIPMLTDWVPDAFGTIASGVSSFSDAIKPLIETVIQNPKAIASGFAAIGAGIAAMKTVNGISSIAGKVNEIGGLSKALRTFGMTLIGNPWATGAAAVTAAIVGIGAAVHQYNDMQIESSLEDHFGDISLSAEQASEFASKVLNQEYLVNITASLGEFENADNLAKEAEEALKRNDVIEWKARVGVTLTEDEQADYISNIASYTDSIIDALESQTYAASLTVKTMLKSESGNSLASQISQWASEDLESLDTLSGQLTNLVQSALTDGIIDVDEQAAIDILQGKINAIMSGWKEAEAQAELDLISQKYGHMSGADLTDESFTQVVNALREQRQTAAEALDADAKEFYSIINGLMNSGRLTESEGAAYKEEFAVAAKNQEAQTLMTGVQLEQNTLSDAYGEVLDKNYASIQEKTSNFLSDATNYLEDEDYYALSNALENGYSQAMESTSLISSGDQKALARKFEEMKPDVEEMGSLIDEYRQLGQKVPVDVMQAFNEAMQLGAAAGDTDAAWHTFAQSMVSDPANEALIQAIADGTVSVPEELRTALERVTAEVTDDPVTMESLTAELENVEVNEERVDELLTKALEGLEATGETVELPGGEIAVQYEVKAGQTMSEIAQNAGIALEELIAANPQIENPNVIQIGQEINIPASAVTVDASGVGEATEQAVSEQTASADGGEIETTADIVLEAGETDASQVEEQAQTALDTQMETMETDSTANVTMTKGSDNVMEVYDEVGGIVSSAWSNPYSASGVVNVTLTANYSLANPTATISFGGGGSGSATVTASLHADGGYFDQAHMGIVAEAGPEYIIPMDGSDRSIAMWQDAGTKLGVMPGFTDSAYTGLPSVNSVISPDSQQASDTAMSTSSKDVNLNINGGTPIRVQGGQGLSRDDVIDVIMNNVKQVILDIIEQEVLTESEGAYEY